MNQFVKKVSGCNNFYNISFACSQCYEINMNFLIHIKFLLQEYMF